MIFPKKKLILFFLILPMSLISMENKENKHIEIFCNKDKKIVTWPCDIIDFSPTFKKDLDDQNYNGQLMIPDTIDSKTILLIGSLLKKLNEKFNNKDCFKQLVKTFSYKIAAKCIRMTKELTSIAVKAEDFLLTTAYLNLPLFTQIASIERLSQFLNDEANINVVSHISSFIIQNSAIKETFLEMINLIPKIDSCFLPSNFTFISPNGNSTVQVHSYNAKLYIALYPFNEVDKKLERQLPDDTVINKIIWSPDSNYILLIMIDKLMLVKASDCTWIVIDTFSNLPIDDAKFNKLATKLLIEKDSNFLIYDIAKANFCDYSKGAEAYWEKYYFNDDYTHVILDAVKTLNSSKLVILPVGDQSEVFLQNDCWGDWFSWSPDNRLIISLSTTDFQKKIIKVYNSITGKIKYVFEHESSVVFHRIEQKNQITTHQQIYDTGMSTAFLVHLFTKDSKKLLIITCDTILYVWDLTTGVYEKKIKLGFTSTFDLTGFRQFEHIYLSPDERDLTIIANYSSSKNDTSIDYKNHYKKISYHIYSDVEQYMDTKLTISQAALLLALTKTKQQNAHFNWTQWARNVYENFANDGMECTQIGNTFRQLIDETANRQKNKLTLSMI